MMSPVRYFGRNDQALVLLHCSPRSVLWRILACGILVITGLAGADDSKVPARKRSPADDLAIADELKEAFDVGFQVGPKSIQKAQERFVHVRRLAPGDPRIDYSHGLMLTRQSQMKLAVGQFEAAVAQKGPPLWPAWKAAIWGLLAEKQFESGLNRLVEFAILVHEKAPENANGESPEDGDREVSEDQREAARWIGQLLEALTQLPESKKYKDLIEERQSRALDALGNELSLSVEDGRELLRARAFELGMAADVARDTVGQLAKRRKLDKELDAISKDKGKTPTTKEEWKKWIDDILAKVDKQLGQLDRDFQSFKQRADALEQSYALASTQLIAIKARMNLAHHEHFGHLNMMVLKDQLVACNDQITAYQVEYNVVVGQMSDVVERASEIANRRASAIARYEMETGDTIKKNPDLDKWVTRLNAQRPKLAAKPAAKAGKKAASEIKRPTTLKALMPLDLEHERDEVLASFGFRPPTPADVPTSDEGAASASNARAAPVAEK